MDLINDGYSYIYMVALFSGLLHQGAAGRFDCYKVTDSRRFKQYENSCYRIIDYHSEYWEDAQIFCNQFRGNLATISKKATLEFLKSHWNLTSENYWIGLYLNESVTSEDFVTRRRANWKWLDGTKYDWTKFEQQTDFGWSVGEPGKGESLVSLFNGVTWRAIQNTTYDRYRYPFICQTDLPDAVSPTSTPSTTFSNQACGGSWKYNETTKLCYILNLSEMSLFWTDIEDKCKNAGGHLASLSTQERHDAAVAIVREENLFSEDVYIGLMREDGADRINTTFGWKWTDGSPYMFHKWAVNEPDQGDRYAVLGREYWSGWHFAYFYLCQKEPMEIMSPDVPMQNEDSSATDKTGVSGGSSGPDGSGKSGILGPVLGGVLGGVIVIALALVFFGIFMKRQRETQFNALMHHLKIDQWFKTSTIPEEPYSDIKDEDMDKCNIEDEDMDECNVYYNETGDRGPHSRNSSLGVGKVSPTSVQQVPSDVPCDDPYELTSMPEHQYTTLERIPSRVNN